jgi:hypothetical protein
VTAIGSKLSAFLLFLVFLGSLPGGSQAQGQTNPPANATITGEGADDDFGWRVAPAGDVNGDGYLDIIIMASAN